MGVHIGLVKRAVDAVLNFSDYETEAYESQSSVEDWALDALQYARLGTKQGNRMATALLDRYESAEWDSGEYPRVDYDFEAFEKEFNAASTQQAS